MTLKTVKKKGGKTSSRAGASPSKATAKGGKSPAKPRKTRIFGKRSPRLWLAVLAFATGLTAITLIWALNLAPMKRFGPGVSPPSVMASKAGFDKPALPLSKEIAKHVPPAPVNRVRSEVVATVAAEAVEPLKSGRVYEVYDAKVLEQQVKEVDLALVQTIMALDLDPRSVRHLDIQMKTRNGQKYHTQSLSIGLDRDVESFIDMLRANLELWVESADLRLVRKDMLKQEWRVSLLNLPTHTLYLELNGIKTPPPPKPLKPGVGSRLVVIIDDLGESVHQARALTNLSFPVTFAVLPHSSKTREVASLGAAAGREVLLHQPMEPLDYPQRADPGPGALFVGMDEEQIRFVLQENLAQVPQAIGVNNHMGSRFTADDHGMALVLKDLKNRGLFFLDSLTTGDSVAQKQAERVGLAYLRRHIFLDNVQNVQAILFQLRKAERLAHSTGAVIAIGHPYPETLQALKIWERERDVQIDIVSLGSVLTGPALAGR